MRARPRAVFGRKRYDWYYVALRVVYSTPGTDGPTPGTMVPVLFARSLLARRRAAA